MASTDNHDASPYGESSSAANDADSVLPNALSTRNIEAFGRKVTTTAGHLLAPLADPSASTHYQSAMTELHKNMRRPGLQQRVFSFAQASPTEIVRAKLSTSEIQNRALTYLPDELLSNIPEDHNVYSLFQGFQATLPEVSPEHKKGHKRHGSKGPKLLDKQGSSDSGTHPSLKQLEKDKDALNHRLEMLGIRKNMASAEIREVDNKIANLNTMRRIVLERVADLEQEEAMLEHEILDLDNNIEDLQDELEDAAAVAAATADEKPDVEADNSFDSSAMDASFMSESIYERLPSASPRSKRPRNIHRKSMPILHEHFEAGSSIKEIQAHNDVITAMDFDVPFGTMVTAALDDTVRVWDLNAGRCMGMLEGHHASVRCLQVEDNIVATGSMDASIRLWDLSRAEYRPQSANASKATPEDDDDGLVFDDVEEAAPPPSSGMQECPLFTLEAHVAEVTALYFKGDNLISGSADKTLRQWDLQKGRCVQTLDVLWAAAQASSTLNANDGPYRQTGRLPDATADFVGALQCFDAALACGTADGMVRLWDLRSGQVHRSLVGHTGPVTCLQFDDVHLITGSLDRSIRIWDLRTGSIHDAFAYDNPVTSMQFDTRRIVSAAGENVAKIYDKTDGRHWDCGAGATAEEHDTVPSIVERVRVKDGYLTEGRRDGMVGIWAC